MVNFFVEGVLVQVVYVDGTVLGRVKGVDMKLVSNLSEFLRIRAATPFMTKRCADAIKNGKVTVLFDLMENRVYYPLDQVENFLK